MKSCVEENFSYHHLVVMEQLLKGRHLMRELASLADPVTSKGDTIPKLRMRNMSKEKRVVKKSTSSKYETLCIILRRVSQKTLNKYKKQGTFIALYLF